MTPEQIEIHRKRFEDKLNPLLSADRLSNGIYRDRDVHLMWQGYLLCAENMPAVEIPDAVLFYTAEIVYLDELVEKLESQGCRVKPR